MTMAKATAKMRKVTRQPMDWIMAPATVPRIMLPKPKPMRVMPLMRPCLSGNHLTMVLMAVL